MKKVLAVFVLLFGVIPISANAETPKEPVLVIDKCLEFCWKPPVQMCAQVLIPVPGRPGYWYTNSCKVNIIGGPDKPKKCLYGVVNGRGYMPTRECVELLRGRN